MIFANRCEYYEDTLMYIKDLHNAVSLIFRPKLYIKRLIEICMLVVLRNITVV